MPRGWFMSNRARGLLALLVVLALLLGTSLSSSAQAPNPVWTGTYYNNSTLSAPAAFTRSDVDIAFDWGLGSPLPQISDNEFSVRWTADIFLEAGTYRFWALADDNLRIVVDSSITVLDTFATGQVDQLVQGDVTLSEGLHQIEVTYRELVDQAFAYVDIANLADNPAGPDFDTPVNTPPDAAWTARYFSNADLEGTPTVIRGEAQPGANWGLDAPLPSIPANQWSARWTTTLNLAGGDYRIRAFADDGVRVFIDGVAVIDEWHIARGEEYVVTRTLSTGNHNVVVDYYESGGVAFLEFAIDPLEAPDPVTTATVTAVQLNVRSAPNVQTGDILRKVTFGAVFPALARTADNTWVKINADGIVGWVSAAYVSVSDLAALPVEDAVAAQPTGYTVLASPYTVNIRTGPGTQFRDIGNLPSGENAQVIGRNTSATWWQIDYNGIVGWVSAQYALIESGAQLSQIPITE